ncbi:MAG: TRAP transporter fused permease subunit [Bauldia litoralis]
MVTTGSITIPIMRRLGYDGALAGAVEVASSTGGSLLPPVMGSAAFLMAEFTGIEYAEIAVAALVPALLYYLAVYTQVHLRSLKMGLKPLESDQIPRMLPTLKRGGMFLVPLVVLTIVLLLGYTPTRVALIGTAAILTVAILRFETRREMIGDPAAIADTVLRFVPLALLTAGLIIEFPLHWLAVGITLVTLAIAVIRRVLGGQGHAGLILGYRAIAETSFRMIPVAGACAAAGLVIGGITMTGLAAKFAHVVYAMTDAQVFPALLVAAALTIVLGLGMPTPSAYILAAMLMAPLLTRLQVPTLGGHLFLLYFAVMSAITPPVAVAAYAASSIAEANPIRIAMLSVKFALGAFIVPFAFVFQPGLLLDGAWHQIALSCVTAGIGVVLLGLGVEGYWRGPIPWWGRLALVAGGLCFISPFLLAMAVAAVVIVAISFLPMSGMRRIEPNSPVP